GVADEFDVVPAGGDEQAGEALAEVLEVAEAGVVGAHGDDVATGAEEGGDVDLVEGPAVLKAAGGAAGDVVAVDVEPVGLVGGDPERGVRGHGVEIEAAAEERVGVVQVPVMAVGPDPAGAGEDVGGGGHGGGRGEDRKSVV